MNSIEQDLLIYERKQHQIDIDQDRNEKAAELEFLWMMKNLETDDIQYTLEHLDGDELRHLTEDLSIGDMRDLTHAGSIISEALQRNIMKQAMESMDRDIDPPDRFNSDE